MRSLLITLATSAMALLLSGCPDLPGGPVPASQSDSPWKSPHAARSGHEGSARTAHESSGHDTAMHHSVSEIAYFQGTIDEAFARRGCPESHPRRTLFRF
jgi:hypothetical protein